MATKDGIDLNDEVTLELYNQILLFKTNTFEEELLFHDPDKSRQGTLQALAHKLDLECEYSLAKGTSRISWPVLEAELSANSTSDFDRFVNSELLENIGGAFASEPTSWNQPQDALSSSEVTPSDELHNLPDLGYWKGHQDGEETWDDNHDFFQDSFNPPRHQSTSLNMNSLDATSATKQNPKQNDTVTSPNYEGWMDFEFGDTTNIAPAADLPSPMNNPFPVDLGTWLPYSQPSPHLPQPSTLILPHHTTWPAMLANPRNHPTGSRNLPTAGTVRKTPTDDQRRQICLYHDENPTVKHTEIGAMFGVERSNVSRILQRKEKYLLPQDPGWSPPTGRKSKFPTKSRFPDIEQALANWVKSTREQGLNLTDDVIKEKARYFATAGNDADLSRTNSTNWLETFKKKNGVGSPKSNHRASRNSHSAFGSRHTSISSQGSGQGYSGSMDLDDTGASAYYEIVFDSRSNRSGSQASACSVASSGRTGPLSEWAKAGMNAVKKIGACWRCKFLRKTCDPETPCALCPKTHNSTNWSTVGCKRGTFQSVMPPIMICPRESRAASELVDMSLLQQPAKILLETIDDSVQDREAAKNDIHNEIRNLEHQLTNLRQGIKGHPSSRAFEASIPISQTQQCQHLENATNLTQILEETTGTNDELVKLINQINVYSGENISYRDIKLMYIGNCTVSDIRDESFHENPYVRQLFETCMPGSRFSQFGRQCPPECVPLNECVLAIAFGAILYNKPPSLFSGLRTPQALAKLLPRVAAYQASYHRDQLIAQSLICLRDSFEVMQMQQQIKALNLPHTRILHNQCTPFSCKIKCIAQLESSISLYQEELSRVFFKKENMRNKVPWFLSAFYSFCIQSFVKKALCIINTNMSQERFHPCEQYLRLPISLFTASSGLQDPLSLKGKSGRYLFENIEGDIEGPELRDYMEAQIAVSRCAWEDAGIGGFADYLQALCERPDTN